MSSPAVRYARIATVLLSIAPALAHARSPGFIVPGPLGALITFAVLIVIGIWVVTRRR